MASTPDPSVLSDQPQKTTAVDEWSQHPENGRVRVEADKAQDGKKKKKPSRRSAGAKKRGTGFEGAFGRTAWLQLR